MPVLGASTRHYRAYGKRTTNVVNKRANLGEPAWAIESDSDDSSEDDDRPASPATLARQRAEKSAPVVGDAVRKPALTKPKKTATTAAASEEAKENLVITSGLSGKATTKAASTDKSALQSPRRRGPLGPKRTVHKQQLADPRPARHDQPEDADSSTDSSSPVLAASKRRTARKRVVVVESASDSSSVSFATPPGTPSPVVSDLSFDESSSSSVQADSSLSGSTPSSLVQEPSNVIFADESAAERVPEKDVDETSSAARDDFATRRRSRRSTAAATTTNNCSTNSALRRRLPSPSVHPVPTELAPLLPHLLSPTIYNFTSFVSAPLAPLASVSTATRSASAAWWTKIGEASYSEVFATAAEEEDGGGRDEIVVVKVIPIADPRPPPRRGGGASTSCGAEELPFLSDWSAIQREIVTSRALGGQDTAVPGFVRYKGAFLVQGSYPEELLASWDDYKEKQSPPSDEQIRPHVFTSTQLYALILLENAGTDLEAYKLKTWREAASVFAQAADALGRAERACGFEHRDLHWGNLLLQPTGNAQRDANPRLSDTELADEATRAVRSLNLVSSSVPLSPSLSGITATLIDFTLSRCVVNNDDDDDRGGAVFDPFEDGEIFEGTGDEQFDVYRRMREVVETEGGEWAAAHPRTNVLWLHYLVRKLLLAKRLKPPPATATINTTPDSPRAVPSPRKLPFARRHTMAAPSAAGPFSPPSPAHRRLRTQPGTMLPGGRKAVLLEREHETERRAYAWLKAVADELDRLVEQVWRLDGRRKRGKASASALSAKHARRAQNVDFSGVTCASDLAQVLFSA